jgi:hypothetical protein
LQAELSLILVALAPIDKNKESYCSQEEAVGSIEVVNYMGKSEEIFPQKQ